MIDPKRIEMMDEQTAAIMRKKTPGELLKMMDEMWQFASRLVRSQLHADNPGWTDEKLQRETARRMSGGAF